MTDSLGAGSKAPDMLAMMAAAIPSGPRESELIRLPDLAAALAAALEPYREVYLPLAGKRLMEALRGDDKFAGTPPAALRVFHCDVSGPRQLDDQVTVLDGVRFASDRERVLGDSGLMLIRGYTLDVIDGNQHTYAPAPRFLAVIRADAAQAFGLPNLMSSGGVGGPPPASSEDTITDACNFPQDRRNIRDSAFCKWLALKRASLEGSRSPTVSLMQCVGLSDGTVRKCVAEGKRLFKESGTQPSKPSKAVIAKNSPWPRRGVLQAGSTAQSEPGTGRKAA